MAPRDRDRQADEHDAAGDGERAGDVAPTRAVPLDVDEVERAVDDREAAEREREPGAQARAERREHEQPGDRRRERDRPGQRVLAEAEPGAAVHERVVERVHEHEQRREGEHERLAGAVAAHRASASSKKPTTRRSYSAGRASMPPAWPASGISHSVLFVARRGVVEAVELLADALHRRGDQQERLVDPAGQVLQMLRRQLVRGHGDRRRLERGDRSAQHLLDARQVLVHVLRVRARTGAFGDHGLELLVRGGGLEHHLAADGEADAADPVRIDVGPALEVLDRGVDVLAAAPAPGVRLTFALALAAAVEQQHPVAVPGEHARLPLRAAAAGEGDHGRAVLRRDVPALELEPVGGRELHVLERRRRGGSAARRRGRCAS